MKSKLRPRNYLKFLLVKVTVKKIVCKSLKTPKPAYLIEKSVCEESIFAMQRRKCLKHVPTSAEHLKKSSETHFGSYISDIRDTLKTLPPEKTILSVQITFESVQFKAYNHFKMFLTCPGECGTS